MDTYPGGQGAANMAVRKNVNDLLHTYFIKLLTPYWPRIEKTLNVLEYDDKSLQVNQFYRREPRTNICPDIGSRFTTVKLVHRSEIYHADRTPEWGIDGSQVIEPQKWGPMEIGRATPGENPRDLADRTG